VESSQLPTNLYQFLWTLGCGVIVLQIAVVGFFLKEWAKDLKKNTEAVIKLTAQMDMILSQVMKIPSLEKDVNNLGAKVRSSNDRSQ
jgi:hypothetical protein